MSSPSSNTTSPQPSSQNTQKKPDKKVKVAIIGAGSGGLSAFGEVRKQTDDLVVINYGPHGTTCARVGCMPSKVMIQVANDFYRRHKMVNEGIHGTEHLTINTREAMQFVRKLRDRFVRGVMGTIEAIGDRNIDGFAKFIDANTLEVNGQKIIAEKIVIATGTTPIIRDEWKEFSDLLLTSDTIFEVEDLPKSIAVFGTGVIGLELGQAMHRMGLQTHILGRSHRVSGLTDPEINNYAIKALQAELPLDFVEHNKLSFKRTEDGKVEVAFADKKIVVEKILAAIGRRLNTKGLGLENIGVELDENGLPPFDRNTMQVGNLPVFIAGDITNELPLLHEASDEGKIAGYNSIRNSMTKFRRSTPLLVTFADPEIAMIGKTHKELLDEGISFETGEVTFEGQGRSIVMQKECGLLHVYGEKSTGKLLGAEMIGPHAEHLAHLLAWSVDQGLTVFDVLKFPFYHPVVEEGLRTSLRDLAKKIDVEQKLELHELR